MILMLVVMKVMMVAEVRRVAMVLVVWGYHGDDNTSNDVHYGDRNSDAY